MFDVAVLGSANLDLVARAPRIPAPGETILARQYDEYAGGKGLNQAVAAARSGADVAFVGAVGGDGAGTALLELAAREHIDTAAVAVRSEVATGRALITVDDSAENSIVVVPGANATVDGVGVPHARVLVSQLEVPVPAVTTALVAARRAGAVTVLNPAPAAPLPPDLLSACTVIVPNEHEVAQVGGAAALLSAGVGAVVVTRGAAGVTVEDAGGVRHQPAFAVDPVDTTGAGDAFCGALAARLALGSDLDDAVRWAAAAGALATTTAGAVPSLPVADAVEQLLARS